MLYCTCSFGVIDGMTFDKGRLQKNPRFAFGFQATGYTIISVCICHIHTLLKKLLKQLYDGAQNYVRCCDMGKANFVFRVTVHSVQTVIAPVLHVDSEDLIF